MKTQITNRLNLFFSETFSGRNLPEDQDIFTDGFVNSLFTLQLVEFVEGAFEIEIENDDLEIENFRTIGRIAALVESKLTTGGR